MMMRPVVCLLVFLLSVASVCVEANSEPGLEPATPDCNPVPCPQEATKPVSLSTSSPPQPAAKGAACSGEESGDTSDTCHEGAADDLHDDGDRECTSGADASKCVKGGHTGPECHPGDEGGKNETNCKRKPSKELNQESDGAGVCTTDNPKDGKCAGDTKDPLANATKEPKEGDPGKEKQLAPPKNPEEKEPESHVHDRAGAPAGPTGDVDIPAPAESVKPGGSDVPSPSGGPTATEGQTENSDKAAGETPPNEVSAAEQPSTNRTETESATGGSDVGNANTTPSEESTTTTTTTTTLPPELTNNKKGDADSSSSISSSVWVRVPLLIVFTLTCILVC
ncbi:uncharacterized protein TM35_000501150 [Trypanosoma theileri]|uniref:Titin n=1 Tax=Trypanosoma theileri TaxID=67003 RepID=A0A1X0NHJ0_9TRYP|nr:uncharacterized protein TM35_000501150 [Trypanosoma theileri]ORC84061.1 hypothetical protein TM35_000501150 [Trypanosoma theileri]